jgi:hypothetical protein
MIALRSSRTSGSVIQCLWLLLLSIDDRQDPEALTACELLRHDIRTPALVRSLVQREYDAQLAPSG